MKPLAPLALAIALCACTPLQWVKRDASPEQFSRDQQECRQLAWREASARYWFYQPMGPIVAPGAGVIYPTGSVVDPYGHQMLEESRLTQFCLESRGYRLVPAAKK